jgi:nifR3 family TIM-barrel protein
MGAEVVVSELVSSEGIVRGGEKTWDLARFCEEERPVGIQIFGSRLDALVQSCQTLEQKGVDFVDLNLGCPVKKVVCDGAGAAWLKQPKELGVVLNAMARSVKIPVTIKIRTGWDESSINVQEIVHTAAESGIAWVAIHGRTRAQGYSGQADWELIRKVANQSPIPIIGNGDILTSERALERIEKGYAHAVMIGRGALKNPWIFQEVLGDKADYSLLSLIDRHFQLALEYKGRKRAFLSLKKFMAWYAAGYPHSSIFRSSIFKTNDVDELRELAHRFFGSVFTRPVVDESEPFLMGGHG